MADDTKTTFLLVGTLMCAILVSLAAMSASWWYREPVPVVVKIDMNERFPKGDLLLPPTIKPQTTTASAAPDLIPEGVIAGVINRVDKIKPPPPTKAAEVDEEDPPEDNGYEKRRDVCSRYGGHRIHFRRHHHIMWRCVYPHRRH